MKSYDFSRAILASELPYPTRLLLHTLVVIADWPSGAIPARFSKSYSELAEMTGMSRRTVQNHMDVAEEKGWVKKKTPTKEAQRKGAKNLYRLSLPSMAGDAIGVVQEVPHPMAGDAIGVWQEVPQAMARDANKPSTFQHNQHAASTAAAAAAILAEKMNISGAEAAAIAAKVIAEKKPTYPDRFIKCLTDEELGEYLAKVQAEAMKTVTADVVARAKTSPSCKHDEPGGDLIHPQSGEPLCVFCRVEHRKLHHVAA